MSVRRFIDLRLRPPGVPPQTYAYQALHDLAGNERALLVCDEDPALLLRQLAHLARDRLAFTVAAVGSGLWRIEIELKRAAAATSVVDLLKHDHLALDTLLIDSLRLAESGCSEEAKTSGRIFIGRLRRHIDIENRLVLERLREHGEGHLGNELKLMQREHDAVLEQLQIIEQVLAAAALDVAELQTWTALLAATLAKHEFREETLIFPRWENRYREAPEMPAWVAAARSELAAAAA